MKKLSFAVALLSMCFYWGSLRIAAFDLHAPYQSGQKPPAISDKIKPYIDGLRSADPVARAKAAISLGRMGKDAVPAIPEMIKLLDDTTALIWQTVEQKWRSFQREMEAGARAVMKPQEYKRVEPEGQWTSVGNEVAKALASIGEAAIEPLISSISRTYAPQALIEIGPVAVLPLIHALDRAEGEAKGRVIWVLGEFKDARAVEPLLRLLSDPTRDVRLSVVSALNRFKDPRSLVPLAELVKVEEDPRVREIAAGILGGIEDPKTPDVLVSILRHYPSVRKETADGITKSDDARVIEALVSLLNDPYATVRKAAAEALGRCQWEAWSDKVQHVRFLVALEDWDGCQKLGADAVPILIDRLTDWSQGIRLNAAKVLGSFKDPRTVEPLALASRDENSSVRTAVAVALGEIGSPDTLPPLLKLMDDPDSEVRETAIRSLGRLKNPLVIDRFLFVANHEEGKWLRRAAVGVLSDIGDPKAAKLFLRLLKDEDETLRKYATWGITKTRPAGVVRLLHVQLEDPDDGVREAAAQSLGSIRDPSSISRLMPRLGDSHHDVRKAAAEALGAMGRPAVSGLIEALKSTDPKIRENAALALGNIGDPSAVDALIIAVSDSDVEARRQAALALGRIKDARGVPALIGGLKDPDQWVIRACADSLGSLIDSRAVDPLIEALMKNTSNWIILEGAAGALAEIGDIKAVGPLINLLEGRNYEYAIKTLTRFGSQAIPALLDALKSSQVEIRTNAVRTLGSIKDERVFPALIEALNDKESKPREEAAAALGKMGDIRAVEPLITCLVDPSVEVSRAAVIALGGLKDYRAVPLLIDYLARETTWFKESIVKSLRSISGQEFGADVSDWIRWWREISKDR